MDKKLVVVIMGQNCEKFIGMCLDSVKDADAIVYLDGGSEDNTVEKVKGFLRFPEFTDVIKNKWSPEDKQMNGKQRNFYLKYLKENYPNDWCLVLDADELVEDLSKVKEFIQDANPGLYNVKMRHFIGDIGHEDATLPVHVVPRRLFKISEAKQYPLHSHPVLNVKDKDCYKGENGRLALMKEVQGACLSTCIWHLGHLPVEYMDYILKRYKQHSEDSTMHTQDYLKRWKLAHLFGQYGNKEINPIELPQQICDRYEINKDEFYFSRYNLELKHPEMVKQWFDYFKPNSVLDLGCGRGCYLKYWKWFLPTQCMGIELSQVAVDNPFTDCISVGDVSKEESYLGDFELITAIDILEHLTEEDLDKTLSLMYKYGKRFLFSIPYIGNPNLETDNTHKIKESKEWWVEKLNKYFKIKDAPKEWLFNEQMLIGDKK